MRKIVYIAGPFRGRNQFETERNVRHAEETGLEVAGLGGAPVIVHSMYRVFQDTLPDKVWTESAMAILARCDAMLLLVGWRKSIGSIIERDEAIRLQLPIFDVSQDDDLRIVWYTLKTWLDGHGSPPPTLID